MCDLSLRTHRYFLEPLAGHRHLKITLMNRFLSFIQQIEKSPKLLPNLLLRTISRSTTGSNLRNILLLTSKYDSAMLVPSDALEIEFVPVPEEETWKINLVKELIDVKWGEASIADFSTDEIDEILEQICTS